MNACGDPEIKPHFDQHHSDQFEAGDNACDQHQTTKQYFFTAFLLPQKGRQVPLCIHSDSSAEASTQLQDDSGSSLTDVQLRVGTFTSTTSCLVLGSCSAVSKVGSLYHTWYDVH